MKMELVQLTPKEQRILLLFDPEEPSPEDDKVRTYLKDHNLEAKRQYQESRDGKEYLTYYFGHCYLEDHLEQLAAMASETKL